MTTEGVPCPAPRAGDVVITPSPTTEGAYSVAQLPAALQFDCPSMDQAIHLGKQYAELQGVDLWHRDQDTHRLLASFRSRQ